MAKIIVAGHVCLDITPVFSAEKVLPLQKIMVPGKLTQMKDITLSTGGVVANTGLALKFLGADVELMGKIGKDELGQIVYSRFQKYNAEKGLIVSKDSSTSYTIAIAPPGTDRIFLHNPGANDTFSLEDLDFGKIAEADLFHFGYPPLMKRTYAEDGRELIEMFRQIKETGTITSLDMAFVDEDSEAGKADWEKILRNVLPYVDYFVPSVEELCAMVDKKRYEEWQKRAGSQDITTVLDIEKDVAPLAEKVLEMGTGNLLIKCGAAGLYFQNGKIRIFERSYKPEIVRSGTGAGDTCIAAFLKAVMDGRSIETCLHLAAAEGASCVEAYDALGGLRTLEELEKKIEAGWAKQ